VSVFVKAACTATTSAHQGIEFVAVTAAQRELAPFAEDGRRLNRRERGPAFLLRSRSHGREADGMNFAGGMRGFQRGHHGFAVQVLLGANKQAHVVVGGSTQSMSSLKRTPRGPRPSQACERHNIDLTPTCTQPAALRRLSSRRVVMPPQHGRWRGQCRRSSRMRP